MVICHFYPFKPLGLVNPTIFLLTSILVAYVLFVIAPFNQLIKNKRVFAHPCLLLSSFGKLTVFVTINLKSKCCIILHYCINWNKVIKMGHTKKKYLGLRVTEETAQQAKFLAEKSGKNISKTVGEIIDAVFNVGCTFQSLNFSYDYCITESRVTITCEGSNNLVCGEYKHPDAKKESKVAPLIVLVNPRKQKLRLKKVEK